MTQENIKPEWKEITPEKELAFLEEKLAKLNAAYHDQDTELAPDSVYDITRNRVRELRTLLNLPLEESVGGRKGKVKHSHPMLSLKDVFDGAELLKWLQKCYKKFNRKFTFTAECKNDGLAISLRYEGGKLTQVLTRGDGSYGEDVIDRFAVLCPSWMTNDVVTNGVIRGEGIVTTEMFNHVNARLSDLSRDLYSTQRHLAAAMLRGSGEFVEGFNFIPYDVITDDISTFSTQAEKLIALEGSSSYTHSTNLLIGQFQFDGTITTLNEKELLTKLINDIEKSRATHPHLLDGLVFKVNLLTDQQTLGSTTSWPNWAIAYKFPAEGQWSVLRSVYWQVGKHGNLTPVAEIDPVRVGGVEITNPTLHNWGEIFRLGVKIGSKVYVERRGDVIPKITYSEPGDTAVDIPYPEHCPCCDNTTIEVGAYIQCANPRCVEKVVNRICDAVSDKGLDIRGLGPVSIRNLVESGMVSHVSDLFNLSLIDLSEEGELGENANGVMDHLDTARKGVTFAKAIYALGWLGIGVVKAKHLAAKYGTVETALQDPELTEVKKNDLEILSKCVNVLPDNSGSTPSTVRGYVCITGSFDEPRSAIVESWEKEGYKVSNDVTTKTTYLLVGKNPTQRKIDQAAAKGVVRITSNVGNLSAIKDILIGFN